MNVVPSSIPSIAFIGILIPLVLFVAIAAIIIAVLYFRHRERMAYLSGGRAYPPPPPPQQPYAPPGAPPYPYPPALPPHPLATALNTTGIGLGITLGFLTLGFGPWLIVGLIPLFVGLVRLGLLQFEPPQPPVPAPERLRWLRRGLWTGAIGLALVLAFLTLGIGPWLLPGAITLGYGVGQLGAYALEPHLRPRTPPTGL
jgi:hypothetical protein